MREIREGAIVRIKDIKNNESDTQYNVRFITNDEHCTLKALKGECFKVKKKEELVLC